MLQVGFDGEILGGESREKISTSSDVDGMVRVDRVVERSVVSEDGQAVLTQQVQQSAQQMAPTPDIEMATKTEFTALGTHVMLNMKNLLDLSTVTTKLWHNVDAIESKMEANNKETQAAMKELVSKIQIQANMQVKDK